ncbi:hypothetical protein [Streptomyces sp. NPDC037389]|uniref:hypothetical protein n=1 Tax=Streptomyces sp. NPDC037389 TaxID=3155369 RepID=UPI0033CFC31C
MAATIVAGISGSLLSKGVSSYIPGGKISLAILLAILLIATLTSELLSGSDGDENLGAVRQKLSQTLGIISALTLTAGTFLAFAYYAPGWLAALTRESGLNGSWLGESRYTGTDQSAKTRLEMHVSDERLTGSLTVEGRIACRWAIYGKSIFDSGEQYLKARKETGPWQCAEDFPITVELLSDRRIAVKFQENFRGPDRGLYQLGLNGVLSPENQGKKDS